MATTLAAIFSITLIRYLVLAGVPFLLFYILLSTSTGKYKIQKRTATRKDFFREILHSSSSSLVFAVISAIILFTPLKSYTLLYNDFNEFPLWWIPVSLVVSLVIHDTYFYWMHRMMHHKRSSGSRIKCITNQPIPHPGRLTPSISWRRWPRGYFAGAGIYAAHAPGCADPLYRGKPHH